MRFLYYVLYYFIACRLPYAERWKFIGRWSAGFRRFLCRRLFGGTGQTFGVGKGVDFGYQAQNIFLKDHANLGDYLKCGGRGRLIVGRHVMMGDDVIIMTQNHKYLCPEGYDGYEAGNVTIGDYVWVGSRVIILRGVTIGRHAIIGAGAVVTKDIPAYGIAVGNPARVIKSRQVDAGGV